MHCGISNNDSARYLVYRPLIRFICHLVNTSIHNSPRPRFRNLFPPNHLNNRLLFSTRRVPVEGKSSMCLICLKYRIIFLIIIIISLGKILFSYIAIHITHARMHTLEHAHPTSTNDLRCVGAPNHDGVMVERPSFRRWRDNGRSATH